MEGESRKCMQRNREGGRKCNMQMAPKATQKSKIKKQLCLVNKIHVHYIIARKTRRC